MSRMSSLSEQGRGRKEALATVLEHNGRRASRKDARHIVGRRDIALEVLDSVKSCAGPGVSRHGDDFGLGIALPELLDDVRALKAATARDEDRRRVHSESSTAGCIGYCVREPG
jgi:hypothetical protein